MTDNTPTPHPDLVTAGSEAYSHQTVEKAVQAAPPPTVGANSSLRAAKVLAALGLATLSAEGENPLAAPGSAELNRRTREALVKEKALKTKRAAAEIRKANLTAKELNFRRRLPKGHPDRLP